MNSSDFIRELSNYFKAKISCIWVNSAEEKRVEQIIIKTYHEIFPESGYGFCWSIGLGGVKTNLSNGQPVLSPKKRSEDRFADATEEDPNKIPPIPNVFLKRIYNETEPSLYIIRDFPDFGRLLGEQRMIRDIYERGLRSSTKRAPYTPLVIISTTRNVPLMLQRLFSTIDLDLMDEKEINDIVNCFAEDRGIEISNEEASKISRAACGLTKFELGKALNLSFEKEKKLDPKLIARERVQAVKKSSVLTYIEPKKTLDTVGGHGALKEWIHSIKACMSPEAEAYGVAASKGFIAMGLAGTGKVAY